MLTNNFYKALYDNMANSEIFMDGGLIRTNGTSYSISTIDSYRDIFPFSVKTVENDFLATTNQTQSGHISHAIGLIIGSDDTPPTLNDYKLGNQITTGFTCQLMRPNNDEVTVTAKKFILNLSVTNTSSDDLTIKELGYIRTASWESFLLDRTVFDTPVVIKPGATKTFEYRLNMPQP